MPPPPFPTYPPYLITPKICSVLVVQELIAEAVCAGWADARYAFAPPTLEKGDGGYKGPTSKEERGKLEGNVLRQIRKTLEEE